MSGSISEPVPRCDAHSQAALIGRVALCRTNVGIHVNCSIVGIEMDSNKTFIDWEFIEKYTYHQDFLYKDFYVW